MQHWLAAGGDITPALALCCSYGALQLPEVEQMLPNATMSHQVNGHENHRKLTNEKNSPNNAATITDKTVEFSVG